MAGVERITPQMLCLLEVLISDPDAEWWGLALSKVAGIRSPTVYRALARLEAARWVTSLPEEIHPALEGRPRRRLYRLTSDGRCEAARLLAVRETEEATPTANAAQWGFRPRGAMA
jgi:PadR family transcriptional regulator PadR